MSAIEFIGGLGMIAGVLGIVPAYIIAFTGSAVAGGLIAIGCAVLILAGSFLLSN